MAGQNAPSKSPSPLIAVAWLVVILPAGWGLTYTVQNALKLFTKTSTAATGLPLASPASH